MFEILGYLKESEERLLKHITKSIEAFYDFSDGKFSDVKNSVVIVPPSKDAITHYLKNNTVILSAENPSLPGILSFDEYKRLLSSFENFKDIYTELNLCCSDFNFEKRTKETLSLNRGILNSYIHGSEIFRDELSGVSYYTYKGHLVWIHDPLSVSQRHNLIKKMGFKGIFIRDVKMAADGNWDSLCGMKKARSQ